MMGFEHSLCSLPTCKKQKEVERVVSIETESQFGVRRIVLMKELSYRQDKKKCSNLLGSLKAMTIFARIMVLTLVKFQFA